MGHKHDKKKSNEDKKGDSNLVNDALAATQIVFTVANGAPGLSAVPFLQPAAKITLSILQTIDTVRDNKSDLKQIANDAEKLILVIYNAYESSENKATWPGKSLKGSLEDLISTLEKTERLAKRRAKRSALGRFVTSIIDTKKIKEYRHDMDQAKGRFDVDSQLKANELLLRIEGYLDASIHQTQQKEQATKEEVEEKQAKLKEVEEENLEADAQAKQETLKLEAEINLKEEKLKRNTQEAKERDETRERALEALRKVSLREKEEQAKLESEEVERMAARHREEMKDIRWKEEEATRRKQGNERRRQEKIARREPSWQRPGPTSSPGPSHNSSVSFFNEASGVYMSGTPTFNVTQGR